MRESAAQCAYHKCSPEAGIRAIGTMMTGVVTVIAITTTGIGVTDGAAGTTRIGIPGTDPLTSTSGGAAIRTPPLGASGIICALWGL